ncbi:MAG: TrpB-like pyridoxal phosphate-dependent enzyme [Oscillospiraceae bacterium]|nr:TrpB-like pyridoxal phosphate-dependent enzyme [Oscillospiraceae bacterium]
MANEKIPYKIYLTEEEMPKTWYNVRADMKNKPAPLVNPGTLQPMKAEELAPVFCDELIKQELDNDTRYYPIPEEILSFYKMYRPSPLVRAYCLEEKLQTPAKIYYKFEGNNTSGSHKLNSAIAQANYAKKQGLRGVTTETGAGQWGTALSMACAYLGLDLKVFMVKVSYEQKPFRREVMRTYGASVTPSPSDTTNVGRKILAEHPDTTGSLGCAISEAVEVAVSNPGYRYVLGSVLNQVLLHQSVIGCETKIALDKYGITPDIIIGCAGGGSNLGGLISPFMGEKLRGEKDYRIIAVEPASCPSFTRGVYAYDFCDTGMVCPMAKMYTMGSGFIPSANHAGGLRYHGMSPVLSQLYHDGYMEAVSVEQTKVFEAAEYFARTEGILPAPESSHAIRVAIDEALKCKETGEEKTIVFGLTGTGYFDLVAYQKFNDGLMTDSIPTDEELAAYRQTLPPQPKF